MRSSSRSATSTDERQRLRHTRMTRRMPEWMQLRFKAYHRDGASSSRQSALACAKEGQPSRRKRVHVKLERMS